MPDFDVNALLAAGAAGALQPPEPGDAAPPTREAAGAAWTDRLQSAEEVETAATARGVLALAIVMLQLFVDRGALTEAEALGLVDRARGLAATDAGSYGPWVIADAVLRSTSGVLQSIFAENRAREAGTISSATH